MNKSILLICALLVPAITQPKVWSPKGKNKQANILQLVNHVKQEVDAGTIASVEITAELAQAIHTMLDFSSLDKKEIKDLKAITEHIMKETTEES